LLFPETVDQHPGYFWFLVEYFRTKKEKRKKSKRYKMLKMKKSGQDVGERFQMSTLCPFFSAVKLSK